MLKEAELGKRIKMLRTKKGLTLGTLSKITSLTQGYLSKVENSDKGPPVSTLIKIAQALEVRLSDIFNEDQKPIISSITRENARPVIARNSSAYGYSYESLASKYYYRHFDPYIITIPPHRKLPMFQHRGEEMFFLLEGSVKVKISEEEYILNVGDSIYFDSSFPHNALALGDKPAKALMVIYSMDTDRKENP